MTDPAKKEAARAWRYPPRSEHPDDLIFVYRPWCKACGICYELCPAEVLTCDKAGYPVVSKPEACTACYLCEALCPEMAITVYTERRKQRGPARDAPDGPGAEPGSSGAGDRADSTGGDSG
jgi:2-oxoglutarate ferredoxin oxidoreductase subunit delta